MSAMLKAFVKRQPTRFSTATYSAARAGLCLAAMVRSLAGGEHTEAAGQAAPCPPRMPRGSARLRHGSGPRPALRSSRRWAASDPRDACRCWPCLSISKLAFLARAGDSCALMPRQFRMRVPVRPCSAVRRVMSLSTWDVFWSEVHQRAVEDGQGACSLPLATFASWRCSTWVNRSPRSRRTISKRRP